MEGDERRAWTLLTSHGHVLVEIARNPQARVRDISAIIGITERATQSIIADLERAGYVERIRTGRRTHYVLHTDNPFRHAAQDGLLVGPFLELLTGVEGLPRPVVPAVPDPPVPSPLPVPVPVPVPLPVPVAEETLVAAALASEEPSLDPLSPPGFPTAVIGDQPQPLQPLQPPQPAVAPAVPPPATELPDPGLT